MRTSGEPTGGRPHAVRRTQGTAGTTGRVIGTRQVASGSGSLSAGALIPLLIWRIPPCSLQDKGASGSYMGVWPWRG